MIDITNDYFDEKTIDSMLDTYISKKFRLPIINNIMRKTSRDILKSFRIYESSGIVDIMDNYNLLNRKKKIGFIARMGLKGHDEINTNNNIQDKSTLEEVALYNEYTKIEKSSRRRNLNYVTIENVCINVDPESFVNRESFDLCELQISENAHSEEYVPAIFVYKDNFKGKEKDNINNQSILHGILGSEIFERYDLTLQAMDEDYPINKNGMVILRGKKFLVKNIVIHDDEGYKIPDYEPLLVLSK